MIDRKMKIIESQEKTSGSWQKAIKKDSLDDVKNLDIDNDNIL